MEYAYKLIAIGLYFAAMLAIGFYAARKNTDLDDYMLAGRRMRPSVAALSAGASDMSGWLLLGLPGAIYAAGLVEAWIAIGLTIGLSVFILISMFLVVGVLSLVCDNVSDAYRAALKWAAEFMRADGGVEFTIGTEFAGVQFDAQQMAQALAAVQGGKLPESDFWSYLRSIGLIDATKDDEAIRDELETQGANLELDDAPAGAV